METKECEICKKSFSRNARLYKNLCKSCARKATTKKYYEENKEQIRAVEKERRKSPERKEKRNLWYLSNKEELYKRTSRYRKEHPEQYRKYRNKWKINNPEKDKAAKKKYKLENKDKVREAERKRRHSNPEKAAEIIHRRRARKMNNGGIFTDKEWRTVKEKYNYVCLRCFDYEPNIKLTIDHIIPLASGGVNSIENIQPLCLSCNSSKGTKSTDYRCPF